MNKIRPSEYVSCLTLPLKTIEWASLFEDDKKATFRIDGGKWETKLFFLSPAAFFRFTSLVFFLENKFWNAAECPDNFEHTKPFSMEADVDGLNIKLVFFYFDKLIVKSNIACHRKSPQIRQGIAFNELLASEALYIFRQKRR